MSWLSENVFNPIENVGNALFHGDITGGQYQASGSDWLKAGADVATVASLGLGAGALAGGVGVADAAGVGAAGAADAATTAAPTLISEAGTGAADVGAGSLPTATMGFNASPDLAGFLGGSPVTTDTGLPFAGGAVPGGDITPNAYVAQNFGDFGPVSAPGLPPGGTSEAIGYAPSGTLGADSPFAGGTATQPVTAGGPTSLDNLALGNAGQQPLNLAPGTAPTATPTASGGASSAWDTLTNPSKWTLGGVATGAGLAAAGGALGLNLLKSGAAPPGSQPIQNTAGAAAQTFQTQAATGGQLQTYLASGTLPAPQQAQIDQLVKAQKAKVISQYASRGQSTQPGTNSALDQDLAAIDQQGLVMAQQAETALFQAGTQALNGGLNALGISQQGYTTLAQMDQTQNNQLNQSIATFAGAAAGKGTTINLGGTKAA